MVGEKADALAEHLRSIEVLHLGYIGGGGYGQLSNDARSARRIERWSSADPPFQG